MNNSFIITIITDQNIKHQFLFILHDKYKKRHFIRTLYDKTNGFNICIDGIGGYVISDCTWGNGEKEICIYDSMHSMLNLDNDGQESGIYHSLNDAYYK